MYEMKDEFKTGIDFIDEQHARLFEIANEAYTLLKNDFTIDKYDKVIDLVDELKDYTVFHFNAEEEYMDSINYKRRFTQKIEHDAFIKKINEVDYKTIDSDPDKYILELLELLNQWLTGHILHNDKLISKES
ncbi:MULTISPECIES: bacteriohemerythrin [Clostridium]|uniref:Iron-binding protein, hemerythrin n=1 Tax=Clostridium butyricum E4 str. BoNT E BL5262 TaxID=632245 RepID=C4IL19_CLOBU|nr:MULTISPECIES: hemerythrin family protein [Clostridium]APF23690.1 hemerythrin-like metal-binding domain protein [Clostridium butyricum]AXB85348.1 bacteriohemerythrin [Clostridium butyricum]EDT75687.1 iron-binding protein, hemerythrin [Clostridium butyricum 5521]EEP54230.1 iron-binding protein, hemerythrin [Clostridium butyricum E4 str. BoNT E BL5262]EMU55162.1 iron-binding protein, hemerythrin [Clostridium butyricum DKU-01]